MVDTTIQHVDTVVIGGGAAGLFCAFQAGRRGRSVVVLERTAKVGKKILMSGGGRCNFTNLDVTPENFLSRNPHFCKSALSRYSHWDFIALVAEHGIAYHEKTLGQLFCDNSARDILDMLLLECERAGVSVRTGQDIQHVEKAERFRVVTPKLTYVAETLVVATGGLSIPTMGVTGFGYELAEQFGMQVLPTRAGLVPFTLGAPLKSLSESLSGVAFEAVVDAHAAAFAERVLFTHRGLSGPAVLQASSYWQPGSSVDITLIPGVELMESFRNAKQEQPRILLRRLLAQYLPKKMCQALEAQYWPDKAALPLADWRNADLEKVAKQLDPWAVLPSGTEGYRTAEVTLGGVDTHDLSSATMESKAQPGLFFIGEVVDVTGHLGGYNFQWAWSSAYAAALAL